MGQITRRGRKTEKREGGHRHTDTADTADTVAARPLPRESEAGKTVELPPDVVDFIADQIVDCIVLDFMSNPELYGGFPGGIEPNDEE